MVSPKVASKVSSISIIGDDDLCVPYPLELVVMKKRIILCEGLIGGVHFDVLNLNGNLLFQVNGSFWGLTRKRVLRNANGLPILTMHQEISSTRHRWMVHREESSNKNDLLFSVLRPDPLQMRKQLDVFLASNVDKLVHDFHIIGCYFSQSFKVYKGQLLIAEVDHNFTWGSFCLGRPNFRVRINPGVDYAFIVTLLVILNENYLV